MPREPIVTSRPDDGPEDADRDLRPTRIAEMIGQRDVMQRLDIVLDAAKKRGASSTCRSIRQAVRR